MFQQRRTWKIESRIAIHQGPLILKNQHNIILLHSPQVDGLFKLEVPKCVELLCFELNAQIQMVCQAVLQVVFHECNYQKNNV